MTTKELLALVDVWIARGDSLESGAMPTAAAATRLCADELAPIAAALCAEVEALRKDAERLDWLAEHPSALVAGGPNIRAAIDAAKEPK